MIRRKATLFRLYPTPDQVSQMTQISGACRFVYNLALEQRREWYRPGRRFTFASQCRELTQLRAEVDWLRAAPIHPLQQALRDLERAYRNWWAGHGRAPRPRKKGAADSFRFPDPASLKVERTGQSSGRIKLPKLGWVRCANGTGAPCRVASATSPSRAAPVSGLPPSSASRTLPNRPRPRCRLSFDMGIAVFAALSDGGSIAPGNYGKKALRALRTAQRSLSRKRQGSSNRRKAVRRVARVQQRVATARKDFLHKHSTAIAKSHGTVVVEALSVRSMSASAAGTSAAPGRNVRQKSGLNRAILDQGWRTFRIMLGYKLAERGGRLIEVPAAYTSQTCAAFGVIDVASRRDQAHFVCAACGHQADADANAAINILRRGDSALKPVEGHRI